MRQRITYLQEPQDAIDPSTLKVTKNSISTKSLIAAREERITFSLEELPLELVKVLEDSHELHIRWVDQEPYEAISPLVSRMSPGLHVFYTPQRNSNTSELLCPMLKQTFSKTLKCESPEKSFTALPVERFSHSAALQYYTPLPNLLQLVLYILQNVCDTGPSSQTVECEARALSLNLALYIDLNYDTISHALTLTTFSSPQPQNISLTNLTPGSSRLEVGILSVEKALEAEELSLGGFLAVIGEDTKPSPTLFSFPSRHHPTSQTFTSSFKLPTGLHPTLQLNISDATPPMDDRSCSLHAHLTLPKQIFPDKYQLFDPLFMSSKGLKTVHYITTPVDLEAPEYAVDTWGSSLLIELAPLSTTTASLSTAEIPLHLRYLRPNSNATGQAKTEIPYPVLFWACTADEGSKFPINPFDRVNLEYDGLFGPRTLFWHLNPEVATGLEGAGGERLVSKLSVPVLDLDRSRWVESGTGWVVGLGFAWVLWCLVGVWRGSGFGSGRKKEVKVEKKTQ
ncbi:PIG-X domain containing protein [Hyaloscypha variabilis]